MRFCWKHRLAFGLAGFSLSILGSGSVSGQATSSAVTRLLAQAHAAELARQLPAAKRDFQQVLKLQPNNPAALLGLGELLQAQHRLRASLAYFHRVLAVQPRYRYANFALGVSELALNRFQPAIASFRKEMATPHPNPHTRYYLAFAWLDAGHTNLALHQLDREIRLHPNDTRALYQIVVIHERAALAALKHLKQLQPNSALMHMLSGQLDTDESAYPQALQQFQQAEKINPRLPGLELALGAAYLKLGQFQHASTAYRQALQLDPHSPSASYYLGYILLQLQHFQQALPFLRTALAARPNAEGPHLLMGKYDEHFQRLHHAKRQFLQAELADPSDPRPHYLLAVLLRRLHDHTGSAQEMQIYSHLQKRKDRIIAVQP